MLAYPILVNVISIGSPAEDESNTANLSGSITLKSADPMALFSIEENSMLEVTVSDVSRMDAPAILLGKYQTMLQSQLFPIKYRVDYNKQPMFPGGKYN